MRSVGSAGPGTYGPGGPASSVARSFRREPYRVIYHRVQDVLVILSVQHERRDLESEGIEP
jgi:plasmid stabilization system protein ParE